MRLNELHEGTLSRWGGIAALSALGAAGCYAGDTEKPQPQAHAMEEKLDSALAKFIEQWEGRELKVYKDTEGIPTIGVGFNLTRGDAKTKLAAMNINIKDVLSGKVSLTDEQVNKLLAEDVQTAKKYAVKLFTTFDKQPVEVQQILVDMVFNLGYEGLSKFKKMIAAVESLDYTKAAAEMVNSKWYRQVGNRSKHHVKVMQSMQK